MTTKCKLGEFVLRFRMPIAVALLLITSVMGYFATKVRIDTSFEDFFPAAHSNVLLTRSHPKFGGAQTLLLMIEMQHGDIYNPKTLETIHNITRDIDDLPGINHNEVLSLAADRARYVDLIPGGFISHTFMFPNVPKTPAEIIQLRQTVATHADRIGSLVSPSGKAAVIRASLNEGKIDYEALNEDIEAIVSRYQDSDTKISAVGEPIIRGLGYHYLPFFTGILAASLFVIATILYVALGYSSSWWVPLLTGLLSATWGLGFVGFMNYDFDPVMLVVPLILTARDISHGIQWQGRFYDEVSLLKDRSKACVATTNYMFPPGVLSILADIAGVVFISFGGIPVLQHIALAGAIWLSGSLTMVFIFQPILMSIIPLPHTNAKQLVSKGRDLMARAVDKIARIPITPGYTRGFLLSASAVGIVWGLSSGLHQRVGYSEIGTPLYGAHSRINEDIRSVAKYFPADQGWIVVHTPDFPASDSGISPNVVRMEDDLRNFLRANDYVMEVSSFASTIAKPADQTLNYGFPKYFGVPSSNAMGAALWMSMTGNSTATEIYQWFGGWTPTDACIRVLLRDHTAHTLNGLTQQIGEFVNQRVNTDPSLRRVRISYLGGAAGFYAAANAVLFQLDFINISFVLAVVCLFCVVTFRSFTAGVLFLLSCILANFTAFIYMRLNDIGLTIDTIPVISLGIGLGVDYGIYVVSRIRDEVRQGATVDDAIRTAISTTGVAVFSTFTVMIGGIALWGVSPLRFHSEMTALLSLLMLTNFVSGVILLPTYIAWARPRFIAKLEKDRDEEAEFTAAAS